MTNMRAKLARDARNEVAKRLAMGARKHVPAKAKPPTHTRPTVAALARMLKGHTAEYRAAYYRRLTDAAPTPAFKGVLRVFCKAVEETCIEAASTY